MSPINTSERFRSNFKQAKVLLIDDSSDHGILINKAMQQCLPEVTLVHVSNADQAFDLLTDWSTQEWELPKLILQDLYLPNREDGWRLVKQIKAMPSPCSRIPVVMFSSSDNPLDIEEAYQNGIASYLVKPVNFGDWLTYFKELRAYWWETVTLPPVHY